MHFSSKERNGLRAVAELAVRYGDGPVPLSEVAEAQGIPLATLEQVVAPLRRAGLLSATRGANGGYALARPPESITVGEVLRALGDRAAAPCLEPHAACERFPSCITRPIWVAVQERLHETLYDTSLATLARRACDKETV
ncbi:MAG: RrF2 family transcriptional regulator [Anaerolineae bacterium]